MTLIRPPFSTEILTIAGIVETIADDVIPANTLNCDGSAVSRTTYSALFAAIGTLWGAGNGSTTFNVPSLHNRHLRGADRGRGISGGGDSGDVQQDLTGLPNTPFTANSSSSATGIHSHSISFTTDGEHGHNVDYGNDSGNGNMEGNGADVDRQVQTSVNGAHTHSLTSSFDGNHTHVGRLDTFPHGRTRPLSMQLRYVITI